MNINSIAMWVILQNNAGWDSDFAGDLETKIHCPGDPHQRNPNDQATQNGMLIKLGFLKSGNLMN